MLETEIRAVKRFFLLDKLIECGIIINNKILQIHILFYEIQVYYLCAVVFFKDEHRSLFLIEQYIGSVSYIWKVLEGKS